ncbi:MAG: cell division protein FtsA [Verrucomicrobiales bacterium]|nr:cell division protein FtsA [Verrucomicrobiales bacterium]|tara:strand:+ start:1678 stop:2886 length:1209 start_codon:yes stop_codon:yes gene_type:complete
MAVSNIYVGLEIGTSKVCIIVGEVRGDGAIKILGVGQHPSAGVRKGEIVDPETVQTCLHDALARAEERSDVEVNAVFLAVTGSHIQSMNNRGTIRVSDDQMEINGEDLEEVKKIARDVPVPAENGYIHSIIQHYYVDGQEKVLNPLGMLGQKLEADYHIINGVKTRIQNSIKCVREVPIEVEDIVFSPVAAAQVVLNREAKNEGALLIDVGGGTTDYICFVDGVVVASGCVPIGGDHITNDIALVLKIPLARAEKLKVNHGSASLKNTRNIEIAIEGESGKTVEQELLNQIMNARAIELLSLVAEPLQKQGLLAKLGKGIFLTGGSSLMTGIGDVAEEIFGIPVQKAGSTAMSGPSALFENPQYATPVGLIRYAQLLDDQRPKKSALSKLGKSFEKIFGGGR